MVAIPSNVIDKINAQDSVKVLCTVDASGQPHSIPAGSIGAAGPDKMLVGEILMHKASENLKTAKKASFLIVNKMEAYEIVVDNPVRVSEGPMLDELNKMLAAIKLKANAAWLFDVKAVYNQSATPDAGKQIA